MHTGRFGALAECGPWEGICHTSGTTDSQYALHQRAATLTAVECFKQEFIELVLDFGCEIHEFLL